MNGKMQAAREPQLGVAAAKSPVLVKYNYYDWNGGRRDMSEQDMNMNSHNISNNNGGDHRPRAPVQRQLSPEFKQSLDEIVRNSQRVLHDMNSESLESSANTSSHSPSSATPSPQFGDSSLDGGQQQLQQLQPEGGRVHQLMRRYNLASYEQRCVRCRQQVYHMDKVGPLKELSFFHQSCFSCAHCKSKLTLKTYFNNQQTSSGDLEVYCHRHCPKTGPGRLDGQSVGIRCALNAPKVGVLPAPFSLSSTQQHDSSACFAYPVITSGPGSPECRDQQQSHAHQAPAVDSHAMHIQHAVKQTRMHESYRQQQLQGQQLAAAYHQSGASANTERLAKLINLRLEYLEPRQKRLEMRHREEEDALFRVFEQKWRHEESSITEQVRLEWERELAKLIERYRQQLSSIGTGAGGASGRHPAPQWTEQPSANTKVGANGEQLSRIERERMDLEATMTIKLDRKRATLKRKLKEFERQATAELVEKQSSEMLALISKKLDEFRQEHKVSSDVMVMTTS